MEMAMAHLDSKGRVVIPKRVRDKVGISEKSAVFVYAFHDLVFLRKVDMDKASVLESIRRLGE
jgi:AbrB family looped-hinge helix DNA binding protein